MALVFSPSRMTTSILLRPPPLASSSSSSSPSPSPVSTPLPALQPDLSSSSSSSASGSYLDLHRAPSARSTRRIRFAPLPEPSRDLDHHDSFPEDDPQSDPKSATQPAPPDDVHGDFLTLSPTVSPNSTLSSIRSTPTIRPLPDSPSKSRHLSNLKLLRPFSFLRRADSSSSNRSPHSRSSSLPSSRNTSLSSLPHSSSSAPNSPSFQSTRLSRISTEDILSFGRKSLFRARSGSSSSTRPPRTSSPPPKRSDPYRAFHRSASTGSGPAMKPVDEKRDLGEGSSLSHDNAAIAGSGSRKRRSSSSASAPGAGGGRHTSVKLLPSTPTRPSTAPSSPLVPQKRYVKMLNGRVYGAKRYTVQTLANPFANVRDEPEFVEWGYGGMGSVHASAGIASDMWKGVQRSERGGALLAGSSFDSPPASAAGAVTPRRKMSADVPECGMGNVGAGGDEDDGSGMGWVKKRRAEREAKARLEQEAKELERKTQEKRKSGDSMDASMYASTASTTTSLTACTSVASTDLTTPITSPLPSRPPSIMDSELTSSPSLESRDLPPRTVTGEQPSKSDTAHSGATSKDGHEHHVLTAVRLSPDMTSLSRKHARAPLRQVDTETISSGSPGDDEELGKGSDDEEEQDDAGDDDDEDEREVQDVGRKTALGAGVEKISRHVDVEVR